METTKPYSNVWLRCHNAANVWSSHWFYNVSNSAPTTEIIRLPSPVSYNPLLKDGQINLIAQKPTFLDALWPAQVGSSCDIKANM